MTPLSTTTTRNSSLTKTSTRGSTVTRTSTRGSSKGKKPGLLTKLKHAFGSRSSSRNGSDSMNSAFSDEETDDDKPPTQLTVPTSRRRRRSSVFSRSRSRDTRDNADAERELEERKSRCMAIKVAKRDPLPIQRLLVDCEFCNPPPKFGRTVDIDSAGFTSDSVQCAPPPPEAVDNELAWNPGLAEWTRIRNWWLSPTAYAVPAHHMEPDLTPDKFYTVYDKMVYQTRPLKHPLNLDDMLQIVKAGWVGEGTWPSQDDPNDVWSTSDAEEIKEHINMKENPGRGEEGANLSRLTSPSVDNYASATNSGTVTPASSGAVSGVASQRPLVRVSSPAPSGGHVQFSELPHPKGTDLRPTTSGSREGLPPLERLQSGLGGSLKPVRSAQSSLVSLTDSE